MEGVLTSILSTATRGSDDPTKAAIPFIGAVGALEAGHRPRIALLGRLPGAGERGRFTASAFTAQRILLPHHRRRRLCLLLNAVRRRPGRVIAGSGEDQRRLINGTQWAELIAAADRVVAV